jgi:hypothetical protein
MRAVLPLLLAAGTVTLAAQMPPVVRQRGPAPPPAMQGSPMLPADPVAAPLAAASAAVSGPGELFPSLMPLPRGDDLAHFRYETREYFVSGTANGRPYRTRMVVRMPADATRFSGVVLAESMHPSGNAWMFHFTHTYTMTSGHAGVEILTSDPMPFVEFNPARYGEIRVAPDQAPEILAQAGALLRSARSDNPLGGTRVRRLILAGTSASAGVLINYLPAHTVLRLADLKPIYDGFLPTSNGTNIRQVDVPMIQVPTTTEAARGVVPTRQDGDAPGDQFRVYEFPGMPHLDSRHVAAFQPNPCKHPVTLFPMGAYMSVALHHLVEWVDKGIAPPRADRILVDRNTFEDGSLMALDEHGNPRGGIRSPYVDVPAVSYGFPNVGAVPPTPNTVPWVALRGETGIDQLCRNLGYEIAMAPEKLRQMHGSTQNYVSKVRQRVDDLTRAGWSLPLYRELILADAEKVRF